ncbi:MAG TPA: urease accessory UreF family protein [Polyangiales bacterium]
MIASAMMRLLWLVSPALPVGAYAYSRGLEYAIHVGWVHDGPSAGAWIAGVLERQVAQLDAPVLARMHDAYVQGEESLAQHWAQFLSAARESAEFALEDRQLGISLAKVLREAGVPDVPSSGGYAQMFALASVHFGIARDDAVLGYMFAFAESQITAASKLVPLGQSASQRTLQQLMAQLETWAAHALTLDDHELGAHTPGLALASALHETQYTRLFRS